MPSLPMPDHRLISCAHPMQDKPGKSFTKTKQKKPFLMASIFGMKRKELSMAILFKSACSCFGPSMAAKPGKNYLEKTGHCSWKVKPPLQQAEQPFVVWKKEK